MKRIIIFGVVVLALYGSYFFGYQRGYHRALFLQTGTFVSTLDALKRIRGGDVPTGIQRIETLCFLSADFVYGDSVLRHDSLGNSVGKAAIDDLTHYRQTYRTSSAEWTPTEQSLEKHLADWR